MPSIIDCPDLIDALADSLFLNIENYDQNTFDRFFVERKQDVEFLASRLGNVNNFGGNVLVVGEPGVGKTVFIKRFLTSSTFKALTSAQNTHQPNNHTLIDLRPKAYNINNPDEYLDSFRRQISEIIKKHFATLGDPANEISLERDVVRQYDIAANKLEALSMRQPHPSSDSVHYVFVDDVDYVDELCFTQLLEFLRPLLLSRHFCVITACRPPAYNTIRTHRDYNVTLAFQNARTLHLDPLPVHNLLERRIEALVERGASLRDMVNCVVISMCGVFKELRRRSNDTARSRDDIVVDYPFTSKQHHHMQMVSNGNIRDILLMASEYVRYMSVNRSKIIVDTSGGYWIGRDAVIQHFASKDCDGRIRIHNLHERRTFDGVTSAQIKRDKVRKDQIGNSILVILLEFYKEHQYPKSVTQSDLDGLFAQFGVTAAQANEGTDRLLELQLLRRRTLHARQAMGAPTQPRDYDLTDRGYYYLDYLIHWDEYIRAFGNSSHHLSGGSRDVLHAIRASVLDECVNLMIGCSEIFGNQKTGMFPEFRINKVQFVEFYRMRAHDLLAHLDKTDKRQSLRVDEEHIEKLLSVSMNLVSSHNLASSRTFCFHPDRIMRAARECEIPLAYRYVYDAEAFREWVRLHVELLKGDGK